MARGSFSLLMAAGLLGLASIAWAADGGGAKAPAGGPNWAQLSAEQKEALSPLADEWDHYDATRKQKWLAIAARYKDLSPEGQQKLHERMPDLARLTPEQRNRARENFKHVYSLPPEQRRAVTQGFQDLPEERKAELAEQARKKPGPTPRRKPATPAHPAPGNSPGATPPRGAVGLPVLTANEPPGPDPSPVLR